LKKSSNLLLNKSISDICKKNDKGKVIWPKKLENVNYTFLSNKDGHFAWRQLELIHPLLYVDLVNTITDTTNWDPIMHRFEKFNEGVVECVSMPRLSIDNVSHKSKQVTNWWESIEQRSLKMSLEYNYIYSTDITNCYGSIYTHSIEWALTDGGKKEVKKNIENEEKTLGYKVDEKIRNMTNGQTNGIPQGSVLMDFIAEIVLGYADDELSSLINDQKKINKKDFCILRYRDDYRIFVNNSIIGHEIMKCLNKVLFDLGLKMNSCKTSGSDDVITASIKEEKMERIINAPTSQDSQKEILRIYQLSKKFPNSGLIVKELNMFYDEIEKKKTLENTDIELLVAILINISINSPRVFYWVSAIVSVLLKDISKQKRGKIIKLIHKKYDNIPNTSYLDIWLQRIALPYGVDIKYNDKLTKLAFQDIHKE